MVIGIVGSRRRNTDRDYLLCAETFWSVYRSGDSIVSGGCPKGGDRFAEILASRYNIPIKIHYPNWTLYGKSAGFQRNGLIASDCDMLIAVVSSDRTGGTEDTICKTQKLKKKIILVDSDIEHS